VREIEHLTVTSSSVHRWPECDAHRSWAIRHEESKHRVGLQYNGTKPAMWMHNQQGANNV